MRRFFLLLLALCLLLSGCGKKEVEEDAAIGYKPPEVVGNTTQTTDVEAKKEEEQNSASETEPEEKIVNGNKVPVGDYTGKFPIITEENQFSVFSINMNGNDDRDAAGYAARLQTLMDLLVQLNPDVITFQEAGSNWMDYIVPQLEGIYNYYLIYPDDSNKADANPIFFKVEKFEDTSGGCFWISDTPNKASAAADGKYYNCTWLELKEKATDSLIYIFNSRLDTAVSEKGATVIREKCDAVGWQKSIVCSVDLGATIDSAAGQSLQKTLSNSNLSAKADITNVGSKNVSDFSLYTKISLTPFSYNVMSGYNISDHNPIFTQYSINTETLNYGDQFIF